MLTNKDYCDYDTCVALEELGFPIRRIKVKGKEKHVPILLYEAQKWLREEKHIDVLVYLDDLKGYFPFIRIWEGSWKTFVNLEEREVEKVTYSANYEQTLAEGIKCAVKILKENETIHE